MRKKLVVFICAALLALAMPVLAFAATNGSPESHDPIVDSNGDTITYTTTETTENGKTTVALEGKANDDEVVKFAVTADDDANLTVAPSEKDATNVPTNTNYLAKRSFVIEDKGGYVPGTVVTLVYTAGTNYTGLTCVAYVQHDDGTFEEKTLPVDRDGNVTFDMYKLSTVTFGILNKAYTTDNGNGGTSTDSTTTTTTTTTDTKTKATLSDTGSTSPKTGVSA